MKTRNFFFTLTFSLVISLVMSCQREDDMFDELVVAEEPSEASLVDSETPVDAQPFVVDEGAGESNGRILSPPGSGWNLKFSDEFSNNGAVPLTNKWEENVTPSNRSRGLNGRHPNLRYWGWRKEQVEVKNNKLVLRSKKVNESTMHCGSINSKGKYEFKYGYAEAKIDIQDPKYASHTAFWLQGSNQGRINGSGDDGAEIDIFESVWTNNRTKSVVHIDGYGSQHQSSTKPWGASGLNNGYHVFGLHWTPNFLRIYYDGSKKVEYTGQKWIPDVQEFLWLSCGASFEYSKSSSGARQFGSRANGSVQKSFVDYVRVWQQ